MIFRAQRVWGCKGFDGKMWWQELRAEDAICLVNHDSHRLINADVKELVAGAQEMGMDAFMEMIGYRPAEALAVAA